MGGSSDTPLAPAARRVAVVAVGLGAFLTPFMASSVTVALPAIGREFALDTVALSWVASSFLLAAALLLLPLGRLADIHGRRRTFTLGLLLYGTSSLLCALARSAASLYAGRVLQGAGGAMMFATGVAILTSIYPPGERGRAIGLNVAATYFGLSLGPLLGGLLTRHLGWRSLFVANAVLGLAAAAFVARQVRSEWAEARGERFDTVGALLYGAGLSALMSGLARLPGATGLGLVAGGAVALAAFVGWEGRSGSPLLDVTLFRSNTVFAFSNLAALINYSATFAVTFLLSLYLQYVRGLAPDTAGLVLAAQPAVMAACSPFAGRLSDRHEPRVVASAGMAVIVVGLGLFALLRAGTPLALIVVCLMLLGLGFALFSSPNVNAVIGAVDRRSFGVASATLATMRLTGQMLSMGIAAMILATHVGRTAITPDRHAALLAGVRAAFGVFALLCVGGTFASLARGRRRPAASVGVRPDTRG